MNTFSCNGKTYEVDHKGFLVDPAQWDEAFARGMAVEIQMGESLSDKHWNVIRFIRDAYKESGDCPIVYQTCRAAKLSFREFRKLFPTGYLRGACLLAGITYKDRVIDYYGEPAMVNNKKRKDLVEEKVYRVDVRGFLVDASEWDEAFAACRARDMKLPAGLTERHWKVIRFLRDHFQKNGNVATVFECCEANEMELDELERLFPDGYHRGAVKIAGLRVV